MKSLILDDERGIFAYFDNRNFIVHCISEGWKFNAIRSAFEEIGKQVSLHETVKSMIDELEDGYSNVFFFLMQKGKSGMITVNNHAYRKSVLDLYNNKYHRQVHMDQETMLNFAKLFDGVEK